MRSMRYFRLTPLLILLVWLVGAQHPIRVSAGAWSIAGTRQPQGDYLLYLPLQAAARTQSSDPGTDRGAFWLPYIVPPEGAVHTYGTNVAVDAAGGVHVTYTIFLGHDNGRRPAYYAHCAARCANQGNWSLARLSDKVLDARLLLDPLGRPRVMLFVEIDSQAQAYQYQYAACDAGCADSASWTITPVASALEYVAFRAEHTNRYFALDPQGRPAFLYTSAGDAGHGGTFYMVCRDVPVEACTNAANWTEITISSQVLYSEPELAFTPDGRPRFVATEINRAENFVRLVYAECAVDCSQGSAVYVMARGAQSTYRLRLDSSGRPRLAFYTGDGVRNMNLDAHQVYYLWCDADCTNPNLDGWGAYNVRLSPYHGMSLDLVLDQANRPRLAYQMGDGGVGYAWCSATCETATPAWQAQQIEASQVLNTLNPVAPIRRCSISTWRSGMRPALSLDAAGHPRIGFDTEHSYSGEDLDHPGQSCPTTTDIHLARFALLPQP